MNYNQSGIYKDIKSYVWSRALTRSHKCYYVVVQTNDFLLLKDFFCEASSIYIVSTYVGCQTWDLEKPKVCIFCTYLDTYCTSAYKQMQHSWHALKANHS